jgi:small subunit ribosomal protein S20
MPRTKTAKKELRKSTRRRIKNLGQKDTFRKFIKEYERALSSGNADVSKLYKALDKAAKANIIKKNKASRLKSRLTKRARKSAK